jgi:hypothetical protein
LNPLTTVQRPEKSLRVCVDAREVNKFVIADLAKPPPMQEMLRRFYGINYMSSIDLTSAFLQILLEKSSRPWTAFQFEGQVYQFTRVPFVVS